MFSLKLWKLEYEILNIGEDVRPPASSANVAIAERHLGVRNALHWRERELSEQRRPRGNAIDTLTEVRGCRSQQQEAGDDLRLCL